MIRKIPRYCSYLLVSILIPIIFFVITLLKPFIIIRFMSISSNRIGHFAGNVEMYLCAKNNKRNNKKYYDIFFIKP